MPKVTKQSPTNNTIPEEDLPVLQRIRDIEFSPDDGIKCLIYGRSGTGKTAFASTFPGKILFVVCSGSDKPGELRTLDTPKLRGKIKTVTLRNVGELDELSQFLATDGTFRTVVIDHCTGVQDMTMAKILGVPKLPQQKSWGLAQQQDWGQCSYQCKEMFNRLLNLNQNVVMIAQERGGKEDGDLRQPKIGAAMTPSLAGWLNAAVDIICNTYIRPKMVKTKLDTSDGEEVYMEERVPGQVEFCLGTGPDDFYTRKFRKPVGQQIPECIVNPTYEKLLAAMRGQ